MRIRTEEFSLHILQSEIFSSACFYTIKTPVKDICYCTDTYRIDNCNETFNILKDTSVGILMPMLSGTDVISFMSSTEKT